MTQFQIKGGGWVQGVTKKITNFGIEWYGMKVNFPKKNSYFSFSGLVFFKVKI